MFLKVKLIFASVLMYHLWAFREARVRICLKNSNLSISTAQFSEKMPRIHNIPEKKDCPSDPLHLPINNFFSGSKHVPHHWSRDDDFTSTVTWPWSQEIYELQSTTVKCDFFSQKKMASKSKTLPFPRDYRKEQNVNCHIHQSLTEWHKDPMINKNEKEENCKFKQILPSLGLNYPSRDNFWGRMHN